MTLTGFLIGLIPLLFGVAGIVYARELRRHYEAAKAKKEAVAQTTGVMADDPIVQIAGRDGKFTVAAMHGGWTAENVRCTGGALYLSSGAWKPTHMPEKSAVRRRAALRQLRGASLPKAPHPPAGAE